LESAGSPTTRPTFARISVATVPSGTDSAWRYRLYPGKTAAYRV
jgi:hypothetical protein